MTFNYCVTAQKTTAVYNCLVGNFTSPTDLNLVLDKLSYIEVYLVTPEGLRSLKEINLYGRIAVIKSFRRPNEKKDLIFILTLKYNAMILEINRDLAKGDFEVITRANGIISENIGRPSDTGTICDINSQANTIALRIYDGVLNILRMDFSHNDIKSFSIRLEENRLHDFVFLHGYDKPILCFICQEDLTRQLKTFEISDDKELRRGPWFQESVEADSHILIPVPEPFGGVIVIGQQSIAHVIDSNQYQAIAPPELKSAGITSWCKVDNNRFLIGDMNGRLFILILSKTSDENFKAVASSSSKVNSAFSLKLICLGEVSIPSCLAYLDNNYAYIGSRYGDSQLIRLRNSIGDDGKYVEIIDSYVSLAPIVDILVVDLDKQGQDQIITCSGYSKEGSLRIIRNGIGINELATIDLPGIKGVWQLQYKSNFDNVVALAFVGQTKLLKLVNEEVESMFISGFDTSQQTLLCCNINVEEQEMILQATANFIRLISIEEGKLVDEWIPPYSISLISVNDRQLLCSSRTKLFYLEVNGFKVQLINEIETTFEASCLDISPFAGGKSKLCAVGLWGDISVEILSIPDFKLLHKEKLGGEIIARSVLMAHFDHTNYLFTAIGDGSLLYYILNTDNGTLSEKKNVILGTHPTFLKLFRTNSSLNIFACSDRPTVIYSSNGKLIFSNVNLKEVNHMCTLNSVGYPDSLIFTNDNQLLIGQIDQIQKLHIRTIPLYETPRRIAYQESTQTFGITSMRYDVQCADGHTIPLRESASTLAQNITYSQAGSLQTSNAPSTYQNYPNEIEVYNLIIIDQTTFEVLHAHQFRPNENAISLISVKLANDPNEYYVVGTAFVHPEELEPKNGRIVVFRLKDGKLEQVCEKETKGSPYCISEFHGKLLVAINSSIRLFEWKESQGLNIEATTFTSVLSIYLKNRGDFVLVGDIVRSMGLFIYSPVVGSFTSLGSDLETSWLSAMEIIDDDTFIGSDNCFNLYLVKRDESVFDDDPERTKHLKQCGFYHLGDLVNVMKHGYLVMNYPCEINNPIIYKPILYATYSGSIGLIAQITSSYYHCLLQLQKNLAERINSVGKISYDSWRTFVNDKKSVAAENFIDGDLIESFLDLSRSQMNDCINGVMLPVSGPSQPATVDDIIKIVEEFSRIH